MKHLRPFIFLNMSMSADGKIASANRVVTSFGSMRDQRHLLELRARADAVMAGARTVDGAAVNLGPGPAKYRRLRLRHGLEEYNLRVVVSGAGTLDCEAEIFRHRFSPIVVLTTHRVGARRLGRLRRVADEVGVFGEEEVDFQAALDWLRRRWKVRRMLVEGGGRLNEALFRLGYVDEVHLTICPLILGGAQAATIADGFGFEHLDQAMPLRLKSLRRQGDEVFVVFARRVRGKGYHRAGHSGRRNVRAVEGG